MFRSPVVADPTTDVVRTMDPAELIPLSVLALDLPAPAEWSAFLADRGIEIVLDDLGRSAVTKADARQLFTEQREPEVRRREKAAELERQAIEADQLQRAQIWKGLPWHMIPDGVSPAQAMVAAEKDAKPRRRSVLQDALSNLGTVFHPIAPNEE
jgi:hypothetical protein